MSGDDNGILVNNGTGSGSEEASMRSSSSTSSTPVKNDSQQPIVISRRVSRGSMSTPMTSNSLGSSLSLIQGGYNDGKSLHMSKDIGLLTSVPQL